MYIYIYIYINIYIYIHIHMFLGMVSMLVCGYLIVINFCLVYFLCSFFIIFYGSICINV